MTAAIYYHSEAFTTTGPKLMGRNAAGESFIAGYIKYSSATEFWTLTATQKDAQEFTQKVSAGLRSEPVNRLSMSELTELQKPGILFYPGPDISDQVFKRRAITGADSDWSVCGITHTTSSAGAMDSIVSWLTSPVREWDSVICTSQAVKKNVECLLGSQIEFLKEKLSATKFIYPKLPIIPLGINTEQFEFETDQKDFSRKELKIESDSIVVLYVGRLSFHAKANPVVMYQALERVSKNKKLVLVECGWHANEYIESAFKKAAEVICPSVKIITLDGRIEHQRKLAWSSADIFCSLSDNIQETFGITPVEAMAAGLPSLVSDWDGYKDTVRDGIDGFRISTTMPTPGLGVDIVNRYVLGLDSYDMYCGNASSFVSVDVDQLVEKLDLLTSNQSLRVSMGLAAKQRAQNVFDWKFIVPQYEALWSELAQIRSSYQQSNASAIRKPNQWPARMDPYLIFESYPTKTLKTTEKILVTEGSAEETLQKFEKLNELSMVNYTKDINLKPKDVHSIIKRVGNSGMVLSELLGNYEARFRPLVYRAVIWLMKFGILKVGK